MITGWEWILILVGPLVVIAIILSVLASLLRRKKPEIAPAPSTVTKEVIKEKEIIKEVVMVPCSYCGGLMPQTSTFCPNCGARRKA